MGRGEMRSSLTYLHILIPGIQKVNIMTNKPHKDIILVTDGASRGNPGPAARAYLIYVNGILSRRSARFIGVATNNVAEYTAILEGLTEVATMAPDTVTIISDSQLVVRQLEGRYQVKNDNLKQLYDNVMKILTRLPSWAICHRPREHPHIRIADTLCNDALSHQEEEKKE